MFGRWFFLPVFALFACAPSAPPVMSKIVESALVSPAKWAELCPENGQEQWDKPAPPYRIHGNTYQVGTCGLTSVLIVGSDGAMLIDPLTEAGATHVLSNIQVLGLAPEDVTYLVITHEHFDHAAGSAYIVEQTGAKLLAGAEAAKVMESGVVDPGDPQANWLPDMPPVKVDRVLDTEEFIWLGDVEVGGASTPGHTAGAYSWYWESCAGEGDARDCKLITFADSLSPVESDKFRWSDHPSNVEQVRTGTRRLARLPCDILITGHPAASGMVKNARAGKAGGMVNCAEYASNRLAMLDRILAQEAATAEQSQ